MLSELRRERALSEGIFDFSKKAVGICCAKMSFAMYLAIASIYLLILGFGLPAADIYFGWMFRGECAGAPHVPIYLIVMGAISIATALIFTLYQIIIFKAGPMKVVLMSIPCVYVGYISGLFVMAWFIAGNVWLFRMIPCDPSINLLNTASFGIPYAYSCFTPDVAYNETQFYCNKGLHDFLYLETMGRWAIVGFTLLLIFVIICVVMCAIASRFDDGQDEEETQPIILTQKK